MSATAHAEDALVLRQDEAGVATLTLNRPKQYNALSQAKMCIRDSHYLSGWRQGRVDVSRLSD